MKWIARYIGIVVAIGSVGLARAETSVTSPATRPALAERPLPGTRPIPAIQRAVVISVDGLRPDVLLRAKTPNMHRLYESGSFSFWARTTPASITLPSHTTMLTGAEVNHHGIEWNRDLPLLVPIYPAVPTLFESAKRAGYTTAIAAGKSKFAVLAKPYTLDWAFIPDETKTEDAEVAEHAVDIIHKHKPQVLFVHFPSTDNVGHAKGWGTPVQLKTVEKADEALGLVLQALDDEKLTDSTFILLTADHGGAGRLHGPDDPRSRHIPWIAVGPGIRKNLDLTTYPKLVIDTQDTFATVCWLLAIPTNPRDVDGKPITEIMQRNELLHTADSSGSANSAGTPP
ncbi:MAG: type phosphodiesterase/nucleotide pyrophosphatase [Phycisphaerales bacterium]|nr:type phosphodiesterase/nucleotide pyrophosphatase [Phycisphaerales bacterium]